MANYKSKSQKNYVGEKKKSLFVVLKYTENRGTWGAQSVKHPTLDFGSGHYLVVL